MHIPVIKIIAYSLIPKLVHDVYVAGKKLYKESYIFTPPSKKKRDTSPWTKKRFDIVIAKRKTWLEYNANPVHGKIAFTTLINDINYTLNMRKSPRAIAAVWEGKIDRSKLKVGEPIEQRKQSS